MKTNTCFAIVFFFGVLLSATAAFFSHFQGETLVGFVATVLMLVNITLFISTLNKAFVE